MVKIEDDEIGAPVTAGRYVDVHAYEITCLTIGKSMFTFMVGNTASSTNK